MAYKITSEGYALRDAPRYWGVSEEGVLMEILLNGEKMSSYKEVLDVLCGMGLASRNHAVVLIDGVDKSAAFKRAAFMATRLTRAWMTDYPEYLGEIGPRLEAAARLALAEEAAA